MTTDQAEGIIRSATHQLSERDKVIKAIYEDIGLCTIRPSQTYFQNLCSSIISQQLSNKAAKTIYGRFSILLDGDLEPNQVLKYDINDFRSLGISSQKANFMLGLADNFIKNDAFWSNLPNLSNDEAKKNLCSIRGIGEWTADMFLIFSLFRLDVLPLGDVGLQNAMKHFYSLPEKPDTHLMKDIAKNWGEHSAVASWYMWKGYDNL